MRVAHAHLTQTFLKVAFIVSVEGILSAQILFGARRVVF